MSKRETFRSPCTTLNENEVLVYFGNQVGILTGYLNILRVRFGARDGRIVGKNGDKTYAICSYKYNLPSYIAPDRIIFPKEYIFRQIEKLYQTAIENPKTKYLVSFWTPDATYTGYTMEEVAQLFSRKMIPKNVIFNHELNNLIV